MNIIRTTAIELTTIPAIAYKQKLASGGAGIRILRLDQDAVAVFTIERRTGEVTPYGIVDKSLFPDEAIDEAIDVTTGLPYSSRGKIKVTVFEEKKEAEDVEETEVEKIDMVDSEEYKAIVERYTDERGKLNYQLMNKDFIQFASRSSTVAEMVDKGIDSEEILLFIVKSRATFISGKKESLSDKDVEFLMETLDEIDPRGAFKELNAHIRRMLTKK